MMQLLLVLQLLSSCLAGPGDQLEQALKLLQEQQATQRQQQELLLMIQQQQQLLQQQQQQNQQQQLQMLLPPTPFMQVQPMQLFPQMQLWPTQMQMPPQMQFPPQPPQPQVPPFPSGRPGGRLGICSSEPAGPVAAPPLEPPIEEIEDDQLQELPWFHCPKPVAPKPPSKEARTLKSRVFIKSSSN